MTFRSVFLGAPGSGKGTQSAKLVERREVLHLSTGDMLRAHRAEGTELGAKAEGFMDAGKLVPDDLIIEMVQERLTGLAAGGSWILDGFPRTLPQARALDDSLEDPLTHVIFFRVPEDVLVSRLSGRWTCPSCGAIWHETNKPPKVAGTCDACGGELRQREDDRPEAVRARLEVYRTQTEPLLDHYRAAGLLREIDADREPEEVFDSLTHELNQDR